MNSRKPRICALTARGFSRSAFMGGTYEAQDVLLSIDDAELLYLRPARAYQLKQNIHKRIVWRDFTRTVVSANLSFEPIKFTREYELYVAYFPCFIDHHLIQAAAVRGWRDYCKTSICWIDEIYAVDVPKLKYWMPLLKQFDHIVIGYAGTLPALAQSVSQPCHCVPNGIDTLRFTPFPRTPERAIDVYNMGRRSEALHRVLLELAAENNLFYFFDTFETSMTNLYDYKQHRDMLADIMKRSRFFIVAPAKAGSEKEIQNQVELGFRYYEGSTAGAILLGPTPKSKTFDSMFDWPDSIVEINPDGSDAAEVISSLLRQPKRLLEISRRNAVEGLQRHDWIYRWKKIFDIAGLKPTSQFEARERKLKELAEQAGNG